MAERSTGDLALYLRLVRDARRFWPHIALVFILELLATPLALLTPIPLKIIIDNVLGTEPLPDALSIHQLSTPEGLLVFAAALFIVVAILTRLQALGSSLLSTWVGARLTLEFRGRLFRHLQQLSFSYHDSVGTSDSVYRIQYDAPALSRVAIQGVTPFITAAVMLLSMVVIIAGIDLQLALVALAVAPVLFVISRWSRRGVRQRWRLVKRLEKSSMAVVQETLGNLRVVKGFSQEEVEQARFLDVSGSSLSASMGVQAVEGVLKLLSGLTTAVGTAVVMVVGVFHVWSGDLTLGGLVLIIGYLSQLYTPLNTLASSTTTLQSALASAERAYAVLDEQPDVPEAAHPRVLGRATGEIRMEDVSFGYREDREVLRGVSIVVPAGARAGIQGRTGSGKTTFVSLLMRFYDPSAGRILLDGVDLRDISVQDLRSQFAIVPQDPVLFSRTIGENIRYARPEATEDQIMEAARLANAHDFIEALPDGYETMVGERGMSLSGGERQRIAIARAFLKDAPILILDEPTSAVDVGTEAVIVAAMDRLMHGRTTFMIAHRLSTLDSCDLRMLIADGRLSVVDDVLRGQERALHPVMPEAAGAASQLGLDSAEGRPTTGWPESPVAPAGRVGQ